MKLGDKVRCTAYIKRSGNCYEISSDECCFHKGGACNDGVDVDGSHTCDKYKTVTKSFSGVYVGETILNTILNAEYEYPPYGNPGYRFRSYAPKKFAVVYYAGNKKRLVPIDAIVLSETSEA